MSAGSWSYDHTSPTSSGRRYGSWGLKSWAGDDENPVSYKKDGVEIGYRIVRRKGLPPIRVLPNGAVAGNPPKRDRHKDHPYTCDIQVRYDTRCVWPTTGATDALIQATAGMAGPVSLFDANDQIKLIQKLKEKIQGSDFDLSVFLGESNQTLRLIADSAIRVAKGYHHIRKGDLSGAARSLLEGTGRRPLKPYHEWWGRGSYFNVNARSLASNWLELQYGWLPLLEDARGAAYLLAHHFETPLQKSYRTKLQVGRQDTQVTNISPGVDLTGLIQRTTRRSIIARMREKQSVPKLSGILNPAQVAWEIVPFSFVADWFIPIGGWIEARGFAQGLDGVFVITDKHLNVATPAPGWPGADYSGVKHHWIRMTRSVVTELSVPFPAVKPLREALSWKHCANALALVIQAATGGTTRS